MCRKERGKARTFKKFHVHPNAVIALHFDMANGQILIHVTLILIFMHCKCQAI